MYDMNYILSYPVNIYFLSYSQSVFPQTGNQFVFIPSMVSEDTGHGDD